MYKKRKNKGDVTYYLTKENNELHLINKRKIYAKQATKGKTKTTKITVSDFIFEQNEINEIDFTKNGLRECDLLIVKQLIQELDGSE